MKQFIISVVTVMVLFSAMCPSWAQESYTTVNAVEEYSRTGRVPIAAGPVNEPVSPTPTTQDSVEAGRMVISGRVTVDLNGDIHPVRRASRGVSRTEVRRIAGQSAAQAKRAACQHANEVASEAVRKARIAANEAEGNANSYTETRVLGIEPAIVGAATWGKWGVALAILALIGVIAVVAVLVRVFRGPSRYCPDI